MSLVLKADGLVLNGEWVIMAEGFLTPVTRDGLEVPYQAKPYFLKVWALQAKVAESSGDFAPILKTDMQVRRALSRILTSI